MKALNRIRLFKNILLILPILGLIFNCGAAFGQEEKKASSEEDFTLEEIVVTAEFREKSLQDSPLAITAYSSDKLEMKNQITIDQITMQAPNVSLRPGNAGYGSALTAFVRGVGQVDFNPSVEEGVGVYVDDVYYATITGNILDLLDLERVEVLRGPQGTLAGRNALGGAIKLFSRKPEGKDEGFFSLTGGSYDRLDVRGAADFAITDNLFMRIAGVSKSRDGYVTRYDYKCTHPESALPTLIQGASCVLGTEGGQSVTAGRLSLRWIPNDNLEINFSTNMVNDKSESQPSILISAMDNGGSNFPWYSPNGPVSPPFASAVPNNPRFNPTSGVTIPVFYDANRNGVYDAGIDVPHDNRFATPGKYYNYSTYIDTGLTTPDPLFQGSHPGEDLYNYKPVVIPPVNHLESRDYTLSIDYEINENVSIKSITSYREYTNIFGHDVDGSPLTIQLLQERMVHEQWTQELRLNSTLFDEFADTTLGIFYLDKETNEDARVDLAYAGLDFLHGPDITPSTSKAVYGQASLHLTDRMDLTLGARYTKDKKSYTWHRHNPDGTLPEAQTTFWFWEYGNPANSGVSGLDGTSTSYSSDSFDYRIALDYDITEKVMVYGQVATGYRMGGNNARPFFRSQAEGYYFNPEELTNYEVGIKSTLFDQLRLNASAFYNEYSDIQLFVTLCDWAPPGQQEPCGAQRNVGDAEVKGIEIEGMWNPTRSLSTDFSFAYIDYKYTKLDPTADVDPNGRALYTPEFKWNVGAQYRWFLGKWGDLTYRADIAWQDDMQTNPNNFPGTTIDDYYLVNTRLTWRSEDLKWQASLENNNVFDKYYYQTIFGLVDDAGINNAQPGRPAEWAFTIKRTWYID